MIKVFIVKTLVKIYLSTFRYRLKGFEDFEKLAETKRIVFLLWHNQLMGIVGFRNKKHPFVTMISKSKDGDLFAPVVEAMGKNKVVRASSSKGAASGTLEMLDLMNKGWHGAMAADGPKGPKYQVKTGGLYLAKKADCILVPLLMDCKRFWRTRSWDNFLIPKPFSRITLIFSEPIYVSDSLNKETTAAELSDVQKKMMEATSADCKNIL
ncbi:lysophospholipid acyltransferase family protein [Seleniivibrio sp.]|uniref:lysophospholipid acyltransferase family protein n=1 Tax=Seleniivibrio sp. TaxID=2898801 RepID=UPI0025D8DADA|nr:lysophospholipid acyltransferase family protein [Seleniivibrio sp.]MCD8553648.1 lysophospholipid acyltransferase family protein [Seleniivibrio sp.]